MSFNCIRHKHTLLLGATGLDDGCLCGLQIKRSQQVSQKASVYFLNSVKVVDVEVQLGFCIRKSNV